MPEITEKRMEKSLEYLVSTDDDCAHARSLVDGKKEKKKTILAIEFLAAKGTGQERDAKAQSSEKFKEWQEEFEEAVYKYETMRNKRVTETLVVECWRSLNSNRRQAGGNL